MNRVIEIDESELRAQKELGFHLPLTNEEYKRLKDRIPYVPLAGEHFDELNSIYPLHIPEKPVFYSINGDNTAYSLLLRLQNKSISVIGDEEMKTLYMSHAGHYIYGVGAIYETHKNEKTYINMKVRGWLLVKLKSKRSAGVINSEKKK